MKKGLFELISVLFTTILIVSNIIAQKFFDVRIGDLIISLDVGTLLLFPILYIIGDVVPEVYGYSASRKLIWYGFGANLLAVGLFMLAIVLPSSEYFTAQDAFKSILGAAPLLTIASMIGYWSGSFVNSVIMVKMKEKMVKVDPTHKLLPLRTIASTIVGEFIDTALFVTVAVIAGIFPVQLILSLIVTQWLIKVLIETLFTPLTIVVIKKFKKWEKIDAIGTETLNPFAISKN